MQALVLPSIYYGGIPMNTRPVLPVALAIGLGILNGMLYSTTGPVQLHGILKLLTVP